MGRVNHKLVKQRLNEKRSKISDKQFFVSRIVAGYFEDLAVTQTRRYQYNRRVRVLMSWEPKNKFVASTNNQNIKINAGNKIITDIKGRENRFLIVTGCFAHELGHVLYTDFLAMNTYVNNMLNYIWYPCPPKLKLSKDMNRESDLWEYVKEEPANKEMVIMIAKDISNILEDGYVENRMLLNFPGKLGVGLHELREVMRQKAYTVTQMIEQEDDGERHIFESILQLLLQYVKYGEIKYGDEPLSDERIQTVFGLLDVIDEALVNHSGKERMNAVNVILVRCWDYIKDFCEECKRRQTQAEASGSTKTIAETLSEILQSIAGKSEMGEGDSAPIDGSSDENGTSSSVTGNARANTRVAAAQSHSESEDAEGGEMQTETENSENESETKDASNAGNTPLEGAEVAGNLPGDGKQKVTAEDKGDWTPREVERLQASEGGNVEWNTDYKREQYDAAASDIDRLLDKMAEKAACKELEKERIRELNEVAQNISYGNIHEGVYVRVNRIHEVDEKLVHQYQDICDPLIYISKQLQKSLVKQLKDNRTGGKQTGLIMGRRLDAHALCRNDGKVFYKNRLPNEISELAVGLLLDESGSMCSADRSTYARAAAIILHDFCESLEIPVMVYGHTTGYDKQGNDTVELFSYAEFDSFDRDDKYRLMDIGARLCNRDGAALRYVAEALSKRPEAVKLLILVSDGRPSDTGYSGEAAEEDLRGIKQEYQRKNIIFVAAAIGNDKDRIEKIYGDSFLDITDLNQLPVKLTTVVKKHIRV